MPEEKSLDSTIAANGCGSPFASPSSWGNDVRYGNRTLRIETMDAMVRALHRATVATQVTDDVLEVIAAEAKAALALLQSSEGWRPSALESLARRGREQK